MHKIASLLASTALALAGVSLIAVAVPEIAVAQAAKKGKESGPKINPKVLKPLQAALAAIEAGKFPEAEAELAKANAVPDKTPFEQFQLDEVAGIAALRQARYNDAAGAFERGLASGLLPAEQLNNRLRLLSQLYLQTDPKDLAKSGDYAKRWLQASGTRDPVMLGYAGQSAYFGDNPGEAATFMKEAVDVTKAEGKKPEESWLLVLQSAYAKLKNSPGVAEATMDLVRYYPNQDHWNTLKRGLLGQAAGKDRQILQIFRLMYVADAMDQPDDYLEAANAAKLLGSPGEAVQFMDKGFASGVLENSGDKARSQAARDEYRQLAESDRKTLPQFEKEAQAAKAGEADVRLGEAYLSYDQPAKGLEAIQRGIAKGGLKSIDEANLALGRAYILNNNTAEAVKAFAAVTGPEYAQLAELWIVHAGRQ